MSAGVKSFCEIEEMRTPELKSSFDSVDPNAFLDPGSWPSSISDNFRQLVVKQGPFQVTNMKFPTNEEHRKFNVSHYNRRLYNGTSVARSWLLYSISKNAVFCFCCKLFSSGSRNASLTSTIGFCD